MCYLLGYIAIKILNLMCSVDGVIVHTILCVRWQLLLIVRCGFDSLPCLTLILPIIISPVFPQLTSVQLFLLTSGLGELSLSLWDVHLIYELTKNKIMFGLSCYKCYCFPKKL